MLSDETGTVIKFPIKLAVIVVVIGGLFYVLGQYIASQPQRVEQEAQAEREITVQGKGEVTSTPDVARITLGVTTGTQSTADRALSILSERFQAVFGAVKQFGVEDEDIKTTNLSIRPVHDFRDGQRTLRGFEASESIQIKIRELGKVGDIIAASTREGVNQAGGISFEIDDPQELQEEAQKKAIDDAQENAEQLAKALGVKLGRVKAFTAAEGQPNVPVFQAVSTLESAGDELAGPPVPAGSQDVVATVSITYELK